MEKTKSFIPVVAGFIPITLAQILGPNPGNCPAREFQLFTKLSFKSCFTVAVFGFYIHQAGNKALSKPGECLHVLSKQILSGSCGRKHSCPFRTGSCNVHCSQLIFRAQMDVNVRERDHQWTRSRLLLNRSTENLQKRSCRLKTYSKHQKNALVYFYV